VNNYLHINPQAQVTCILLEVWKSALEEIAPYSFPNQNTHI